MDEQKIARFEQLYREQLDFVWGVARTLGTLEAAVPDVVQEVFITAYRRLDAIDPQVSPRGWLYAVTRRVVFRVRRTAARTARREAALRRIPEATAQPHARDEAAVDLARLLDGLDASQRQVFVMADVLGMSGPEVASEIGVPLDTVYSRLRLARGRLQRIAREGTIADAVARARTPVEPAHARRTWAALLLAVPRSATWLGGIGLAKLGLVGVAAIGVVAIAIGVGGAPPATTTTTTTTTTATTTGASMLDASLPAEPPSIPTPIDVARPASASSASRSSSASRAAAPRSTAATAAPSTAAPEPQAPVVTGIEAELAALERAKQRLDARDASGALAILDDGAAFPTRTLADARGALRVRALCELGRTDEAQRAAARLRALHPDSHAARSAKCS